jgi:carbamate kinase
MLVVAALGGNALLRRGEPPETTRQVANIRTAARALAEIAREHDLVVTHGNGPQVGLLAMQSGDPLYMLSAETEGMIGYMIETALRNELPGRDVAGVLTQIAVDPDDPAFETPGKPIGPVYDEEQARRLASEYRWTIAPDDGGYRHVVPSPRPLRILEIDTIRLLVRNEILVICAGGGGIPVVAEKSGWRGVEAVIDKDHASALLARELGADALLRRGPAGLRLCARIDGPKGRGCDRLCPGLGQNGRHRPAAGRRGHPARRSGYKGDSLIGIQGRMRKKTGGR